MKYLSIILLLAGVVVCSGCGSVNIKELSEPQNCKLNFIEKQTVKIPYEDSECLKLVNSQTYQNICDKTINVHIPYYKELSVQEAVQLLIDAGGYKYVPEVSETKPARLTK